jgi:spoIIIJ-associated protein
MDQQNLNTTTNQIFERLLELLAINASFETSVEENEGAFVVNVEMQEVDESGLLIGSRGTTLNAIQSFLALSLRQSVGQWVPVRLDVGNWRGRHEDYLEDLASQTAERAVTTGEPQYLYNLSPSQRRVIHVALSKRSDVTSESQGEGVERCLIVTAKSETK